MSFFNFSEQMKEISEKALLKCNEKFAEIDKITEFNQQRVLKAFIDNGVSESHFAGSTGYGYGDRGREVLDEVTAQIFGAEDALIRHSFASGTHTLSVMLFGVLRPGDTVLCATGIPYDTIHSVIGLSGEGMGSLKDFGIDYMQVDLKEDSSVDFDAVKKFTDCVVKETYTDHIIITDLETNTDLWIEEGFNMDCVFPIYNF